MSAVSPRAAVLPTPLRPLSSGDSGFAELPSASRFLSLPLSPRSSSDPQEGTRGLSQPGSQHTGRPPGPPAALPAHHGAPHTLFLTVLSTGFCGSVPQAFQEGLAPPSFVVPGFSGVFSQQDKHCGRKGVGDVWMCAFNSLFVCLSCCPRSFSRPATGLSPFVGPASTWKTQVIPELESNLLGGTARPAALH